MKLELFEDGFEGDDVLLLYSGSLVEVNRLHTHLRELAVAAGEPVRLHTLDWIDAVDACELTLAAGRSSRGVLRDGKAPRFELLLTPDDWDLMADWLEPFCTPETNDDGARFQYLYDGGTRLLYSTSRQW